MSAERRIYRIASNGDTGRPTSGLRCGRRPWKWRTALPQAQPCGNALHNAVSLVNLNAFRPGVRSAALSSNAQWWIHVDLVGIQNYVFGSRRLKDGIGRAAIIADLCDPEYLSDPKHRVLVHGAFVLLRGAGTMTIAVPVEGTAHPDVPPEEVKEIVGRYTRLVLDTSNRLNPVIAVQYVPDSTTQSGLDKALADSGPLLRVSRSRQRPSLGAQAFQGVTRCAFTGLPAQDWMQIAGSPPIPVAGEVAAARARGDERHTEWTKTLLGDVTGPDGMEFTLTTEIDQLGRTEGESSHVGVLVMDFNRLGDTLRALPDTKTLSEASNRLRDVTEALVKDLVGYVASNVENRRHADGAQTAVVAGTPQRLEFELSTEGRQFVLPIRPWVVAGDDIVLLCESRIAWRLADRAMAWLSADLAADDSDSPRRKLRDLDPAFRRADRLALTLGIGIAVVPVGYSIVAAHDLAAGLCKAAKETRRQRNWGGHVVDWHRGAVDAGRVMCDRQSPSQPSGLRPYHHVVGAEESAWSALLDAIDDTAPGSLRSGDPDTGTTWVEHRSWVKGALRAAAQSLDAGEVRGAIQVKIARETVLGHDLPALAPFIGGGDHSGLAVVDVLDLIDDDLKIGGN